MATYCVYQSDIDKKKFEFDRSNTHINEDEARDLLAKAISIECTDCKILLTEFSENKDRYFYLFRGKDNVSGILIVSVRITVNNTKK